MDRKAFERAKKEFEGATTKLQQMQAATDLNSFSQLWAEYLTHVQRAFTKMRIATSSGPSKGWYDKIENTRSEDELLSYVRHARNADEHGIDPITRIGNAAVTIRAKPGQKGLYIDYMRLHGNNTITLGPEATKQAEIVFEPAKIHLIAVRDRGTTYPPPKSHDGKTISEPSPAVVGKLCLGFLERVIIEADSKFPKT